MKQLRVWVLRTAFALAMVLAGYALGAYTFGGYPWGHRSVAVHAQTTQTTTQAQATQATTQVNMPRSWGPLVGTMTGVLVFQDRAGTIRLVAANTGAIGEVITRN